MGFKNQIEFITNFSTEENCRKHLEKIFWSEGIKCPHCKHEKVYKFKDGKTYKCASKTCNRKFNVLTKTVFQDSNLSLVQWFVAFNSISMHGKGISSYKLAKVIGVTQKSAMFVLQRIREAFKVTPKLLSNMVEVDETYIGGKNKNRHYNKRKKNSQGRSVTARIPVFGVLERGGNVYSRKVADVSAKTLRQIIFRFVKKGAHIMSDEWTSYQGLEFRYGRSVVEHGSYQYVNGEAHTNSLEGYWSLVKRTINGTYHHISRKHTDRYCAEFDFSYNNRKKTMEERFNLALFQSQNKKLRYKDLVAN